MNPFSKLINARLPTAAIGLDRGNASAVLLQRQRQQFSLRRAASIALPAGLLNPSYDDRNISSTEEIAAALSDMVTSAGLLKQQRWSVALPEASTRTVIVTIDGNATSRAELEQVLRWKTERGFGATFDELRISRERLAPDATGRPRYLAVGIRLSVLSEYERVFDSLGWRTGLILPRHAGEERWLAPTNGARMNGDALLISSHSEGFTAVMLHGDQPVIVRSVMCDEEDRTDELYRLLLFYRDRVQGDDADTARVGIDRYLVVGTRNFNNLGDMISETLGSEARALDAAEVGLNIPTGDLNFDAIAAPAGLAALAWS